ncbi:universal stress protein [Desulfovibrio ferrophilus]|uniref:UspA domain-containing protein n=1 Tax=Desulfovibrio ferrophilus TaxID=241368 RepID=A0A2Z6B147_9BACT|nr:universal stress protein [Desulfovibrio ferrophilus]BBD09185.1 UspA domain-containing protein [Desulfovibrio ferrophilus]
MRIKKILVPVDGSEPSLTAVEHAAELAALSGASILLLHCHKPVPTTLGEPNFQLVLDRLMADAELVIEIGRAPLDGKGVAHASKVIGGNTAQIIVEVADIEGFDLIVMGSRGLGGVKGLLLGSVTHKVLQAASCPVLVVR